MSVLSSLLKVSPQAKIGCRSSVATGCQLLVSHNPTLVMPPVANWAPLFDTAPFELRGRPTAKGCELWAVTPEGTIAMSAEVELQ